MYSSGSVLIDWRFLFFGCLRVVVCNKLNRVVLIGMGIVYLCWLLFFKYVSMGMFFVSCSLVLLMVVCDFVVNMLKWMNIGF